MAWARILIGATVSVFLTLNTRNQTYTVIQGIVEPGSMFLGFLLFSLLKALLAAAHNSLISAISTLALYSILSKPATLTSGLVPSTSPHVVSRSRAHSH